MLTYNWNNWRPYTAEEAESELRNTTLYHRDCSPDPEDITRPGYEQTFRLVRVRKDRVTLRRNLYFESNEFETDYGYSHDVGTLTTTLKRLFEDYETFGGRPVGMNKTAVRKLARKEPVVSA